MVVSKISLQGRRRKKAIDRRRKKSKVRSVFRRHLFESLESRELLTVFDITSLADTPDACPGDGIAADVDGNATLRAAVMEANASGGADTIRLPAGKFTLTRTGPGEDLADTGDLDITSDITIIGAGSSHSIVDGNFSDRLFDVKEGASLTLQGLTLQNGEEHYAGGIANMGNLAMKDSLLANNTATLAGGGAIHHDGTNGGELTVSTSTFSNNTTKDVGGAISIVGGEISIQDSTFNENVAIGNGGIGVETGSGGAIYAFKDFTMSIVNSTFSGNVANQRHGGAIMVNSSHRDAATSIHSSTFTGNQATSHGGGIFSERPLVIANSIVAGNTAGFSSDDIQQGVIGTVSSQGHNLVGSSEGHSIADGLNGDQVGTADSPIDARLGPLADNGGPTLTHLLLPGSPALDAGSFTAAPTHDQRGMPRPLEAKPAQLAKFSETGIGGSSTSAFQMSGNIIASKHDTGNGVVRVWRINADNTLEHLKDIASPHSTAASSFGSNISIKGDFLGIGSVFASVGAHTHAGQYYVYDLDNYDLISNFNAAPEHAAYFGDVADLSEDILVVGESGNWGSWGTEAAITAYRYSADDLSTTQIFREEFPSAGNGGSHTTGIAIDENVVVAGFSRETENDQLLVLWNVKRDNEGNVTSLQRMSQIGEANDTTELSVRRGELRTNGEYIAIGRHDMNYENGSSGHVQLLRINPNGTMAHERTIVPPDAADGMDFGKSVLFAGNLLYVSAPLTDVNQSGTGKVYVYDMTNEKSFADPVSFTPDDLKSGEQFGLALTESGGRLGVAAGPDALYLFDATNISSQARIDIGAVEVVNQAPVAKNDHYRTDRDQRLISPNPITVSQDFDSDPEWTSLGNGQGGNDFGYRDGKIGGRFTRSSSARHYGDLELDAPVTFDQPFSASGTFEATDINHPDFGNGMIFGHFTVGGSDEGVHNRPFKVGIGLTDNSRGNELWWYGGILDNSGLAVPAKGPVVLELDQQHSWFYSWDPQGGESSNGTLTVTLDDVTSVLELTAEQRAMLTTPMNAFGLSGNAASYPSSGKFAEFFIGDVNYTSGQPKGVLANDSDPDGDLLASLLVEGPEHGTVELNDDGSFSYQPEAGFHGTDSFTYVAHDGYLESNVATVTIDVLCTNQAPLAVDDTYQVDRDGMLTVSHPLERTETFDKDPGWTSSGNGEAGNHFGYQDGRIGGRFARSGFARHYGDLELYAPVTFDQPFSASGTFEATDINHPDFGNGMIFGHFTVGGPDEGVQNGPFKVGIGLTDNSRGNELWWYGGILDNSGLAVPATGHVVLELDQQHSWSYSWDPQGGESSNGTLTVTLDDVASVLELTAEQRAMLTTPMNAFGLSGNAASHPSSGKFAEFFIGDVNYTSGQPKGVLANDSDPDGDLLISLLVEGPEHGTLELGQDGHFTYRPDFDFHGTDSFTYVAHDGHLESNVATVTIDVLCADGSAPVISPLGEALFTSISEDALDNPGNSVAEIVENSIHDADDDSVEGIAVVAVESERGQWQYSLDAGASWQDLDEASQQEALLLRAEDRLRLVPDGKNGELASIQYRAWDQTGPTEGQQGSRVDVTDAGEATPFSVEVDRAEIIASDVNDAPTLDASPSESFQLDSIGHDQHDNPGNSVAEIAAAEIHDVDFHAVEGIAVIGIAVGEGGRWEFSADGGDQWIQLENVDSSHALLLRAEDRIRFLPTGRCADQAGFRFRAWDQTADTLGGEGTYVSIDEVGGTTPYSNDIAEASITIDFDLPDFIVRDDSFDVQEDSSQNLLDVLANDSPLSVVISSVGTSDQGGQVSVSPDGQVIIYTPAADFYGDENLDYTVIDSIGRSASGSILVNVLPVNDDPTAVEDRFQVAEDSSGNLLDVLANDTSSPDQGEQLRVVDVSMPSEGGTVQVSLDGLLRYSPDADFHGLDQFSYTIEDGNGGRSTARVVIEVESINDDPIANDDSFQVSGIGQDYALDVLANDSSSPESGEKLEIVSVTAGSAGGSVTIGDAAEMLFYRPRDGFAGQETFHYTISDGHGGRAVANVTVDVVEVIRQVGSPAVDDTYVSLSSEDLETFSLDVMVNDRLALDEGIWLVSVDEPGHGTATIDPSDGVILYQPEEGFIGTDQFHYAVSDIDGVIHRAQVTVQVQPGADNNDLVRFSMEVVDLEYGEVISEIEVGESFELRIFVQDMRPNVHPQAAGVFAAYLDLLYPADLVQLSDSPDAVQFSGSYGNVHSGDIRTPGVIDELGAVQSGMSPLGGDRVELLRAIFDTVYVGTATLTADPADQTPAHSTLIFQPPEDVLVDQQHLTETVLEIMEPDPTRYLDVNGDGAVSPMDALGIINDLNYNGPGPVEMLPYEIEFFEHSVETFYATAAEGESITRGRRFLDVNRDHYVSPMDALAVINYLNQASGLLQGEGIGMGEGEAAVTVEPGQPAIAGSFSTRPEIMTGQKLLASVIDTTEVAEIINQNGHQQAAHGLSLDLRHEISGSQLTDQAMDSLFAEFDEIGLESELISELATDIERAWSV